MENETILYGFEVGNNILNHEKCVTSHCLKQSIKGNRACIHVRLAKHMSMQPSEQAPSQSDWKLVCDALQSGETFPSNKILVNFAKSDPYRLRYERHGELGKEYIRKLFKTYKGFTDRVSGEAWTHRLCDKINTYERMFENLCEKSEKSGSGTIYRLFDLFKSNKEIRPKMINIQAFMSLIFAIGHFNTHPGSFNNDQFPKTIREFVAKYEFFYKFVERKIDSSEGRYNSFSDEVKAKYLCQSIPCVSKLWNYFAHNSLNLFSIDKKAILENTSVNALYAEKMPQVLTDENLINSLRATFTTNIRQKPCSQLIPDLQSPISFPSGFDTIYHPFKHENCSTIYFQGRNWKIEEIESLSDQGLYSYSRESITEYLKMMNEIILFDEAPIIGIDQFTGETILKYNKIIKIENTDRKFGVMIKCNKNGFSYFLTCYSSPVKSKGEDI